MKRPNILWDEEERFARRAARAFPWLILVPALIAAGFGVVTRVARELGVGTKSLRGWLKQTEIDAGYRHGTSTADKERIAPGAPP